jgi:ribose transport system permease protein
VVKVLVYAISGTLAALAGIVVAGYLNVGDPQFGAGSELNAIAASVIGGIYLMGGRGSVLGTALGILIIGVIANLLNLLNIPGDIQFIVNGVLIVVAVAIQRFRD